MLVWRDEHFVSSIRLFAQHLKANGTIDGAWPAAGCEVCDAGDIRGHERIISDGAGGALVTWEDERSGTNYDIYAQRVRSTGVVDPGWPADGRLLCGLASDQLSPTLAGDGAGGAIVAWEDYRAGEADIYAVRVLSSGAVAPTWTANGVALCSADGYQARPSPSTGTATRSSRGATAQSRRVHIRRAHPANGAVDPAWTADGVAACSEAHGQFMPTAVADGAGGVVVAWTDARGVSGSSDVYAQRVTVSGLVGGSVVGVPHAATGSGLSLTAASPVRGNRVSVAFTLGSGADARIELLDLAGRRITAREVGLLGAGGHTLDVADPAPLAAGIYFLRLSQQGSEVMTRVAVLR